MIKFNEDLCIGCYACYVACIAEHNPPEAENAYSFRSIKRRCLRMQRCRKRLRRMQPLREMLGSLSVWSDI